MTRGNPAPNTQTPPGESGKSPPASYRGAGRGSPCTTLSGGGPPLQGGGGKKWWQGSTDSRMFPEIPTEEFPLVLRIHPFGAVEGEAE